MLSNFPSAWHTVIKLQSATRLVDFVRASHSKNRKIETRTAETHKHTTQTHKDSTHAGSSWQKAWSRENTMKRTRARRQNRFTLLSSKTKKIKKKEEEEEQSTALSRFQASRAQGAKQRLYCPGQESKRKCLDTETIIVQGITRKRKSCERASLWRFYSLSPQRHSFK